MVEQIFRASDFCRRKNEPPKVSVTFSLVAESVPRCREGNGTQLSYTTRRTLRNVSLCSGCVVELEIPDTNRTVAIYLKRGNQNDKDEEDAMVIYVNEFTATQLGIYRLLLRRNTARGFLRHRDHPSVAGTVTMRPLARPVTPLNFLHSSDQDDIIWPLPSPEWLLQVNRIIAVAQYNDVYHYEILEVESKHPRHKPDSLYLSDQSTRYRIRSDEARPCPVLAPLTNTLYLSSSQQRPVPQHPNVAALVETLSRIHVWATPEECLHHIIGTDDNHGVTHAVEAAANTLGRRCVVVSGLAFYGYYSGKVNNPTGSLVDKLEGMQAALEEAIRYIPSLLLVKDVDKELSFHDSSMREDDENRLWTVVISFLARYTFENQPDSQHYSPSLLVLFSSGKSLIPGPLSHRMVFPSFACSLPDAIYADYLWNEYVPNTIHPPLPKISVAEQLIGRGPGEIAAIKEEMKVKFPNNNNTTTTTDPIVLFKEVSATYDSERRKKSILARIPSVKWEDVGGLSHVRGAIMDGIELPLKHPHLFHRAHRFGILLYGPPGVGKTLIAKAVATESNLPFLSIKGPELLGSYVGESESRVRDVFSQARVYARQNNPKACIIFFDELDSIAPRREEGESGGNVMNRVVATLIGELDKESDDCSVFVIGATNRPDLLDQSLLRSGRFDQLLYLGTTASDWEQILTAQLRKLRLDGELAVVVHAVVTRLKGNLTGADLAAITSGAQLIAAERVCLEAEKFVMTSNCEPGAKITIEQYLETCGNDFLTPMVTVKDVMVAAGEVLPSVSDGDIRKYEKARQQFENV